VRITIDQDRCIASGQCVIAAKEVFDQRDEDGVVVLRNANPPAELAEDVREAVMLCPARAIVADESDRLRGALVTTAVQAIDALLVEAVERGVITGLYVMAADRDGVIYSGGAGARDGVVPWSDDTIAFLASMGKSIIAVARCDWSSRVRSVSTTPSATRCPNSPHPRCWRGTTATCHDCVRRDRRSRCAAALAHQRVRLPVPIVDLARTTRPMPYHEFGAKGVHGRRVAADPRPGRGRELRHGTGMGVPCHQSDHRS